MKLSTSARIFFFISSGKTTESTGRTYLFYGPPGAGKSSFIRVLAGHLNRNLCFVQPAGPRMTDEAFQVCMRKAPDNSIIVIEDIDALFGKDRSSLSEKCPLTFSGLLNSLDGVTTKDGQLFVLTTNYIDRLDSALIRPGRVDLRVQFPEPSPEQIKSYFLHFYPGETECAEEFTAEVVRRFCTPSSSSSSPSPTPTSSTPSSPRASVAAQEDGATTTTTTTEEEKEVAVEEKKEPAPVPKLSMAALQQHFIVCRTCTAKEAVEKLAELEIHA